VESPALIPGGTWAARRTGRPEAAAVGRNPGVPAEPIPRRQRDPVLVFVVAHGRHLSMREPPRFRPPGGGPVAGRRGQFGKLWIPHIAASTVGSSTGPWVASLTYWLTMVATTRLRSALTCTSES
jgi:hypothetical protein